MYLFSFFMLFVGLMSIMFMSYSILQILICMEFIVLTLFVLMLLFYSGESVLEVLSFMVMIVGESVLGLILLVLKVSYSGSDLVISKNVF